jgi:Protein of unknown function (DUF3035)
MKKKIVLIGLTAMAIPTLSGCASAGGAAKALWDWDIRGNKAASGPSTGRLAPLVVPPDYALAPAQAGATRPQEAGQEQVLDSLFGGPATRSAGERAISTAAGSSEPGIRSAVGDPQTNTVNKGSVTRDIIAAPEGDGQTAQAVIPG